jgi:hypothetical protein
MAISAELLRIALTNKCMIAFNRNQIHTDDETIIPGQWNNITHDRYRMAITTITREKIQMDGVREDDSKANTVNVIYEESCATMGAVGVPGLIFSESFSGCVFHMYRDALAHVIGVHASRASGKLADPNSWFTARGAKCIYTWDSVGKVAPGCFGAVFAYVDKTTIDFYAVEHKGGKVQRILKEETINSWPVKSI